MDVQQIKHRVAEKADLIHRLQAELGKTIVGQQEMISRLLVGLLTHGHILLEGVPGLAKTTAIKSLAQALSTRFQRIQFTPDLLPADLVGTMIYVPSEGAFRTRKGPIFANFILADEINRAPSKVQSALLEAMQERQVTIGEQTFPLEGLFLVMATQNPIEQEGTYPLPEAQVDRFMLKIKITYPEAARRAEGARHGHGRHGPADPAGAHAGGSLRHAGGGEADLRGRPGEELHPRAGPGHARSGRVRPEGRSLPLIDYGASPRASIYLGLGAGPWPSSRAAATSRRRTSRTSPSTCCATA